MSDLQSQLQSFWDAVTLPSTTAEQADSLFVSGKVPAAERLRVYRSMYRVRLGKVMEATLPSVRAFLGYERFRSMAWKFLRDHPSTEFDIERIGTRMPSYLRDAGEATAAELATLDQAWLQVLRAPNRRVVTAATLAAGGQLDLRLTPAARPLVLEQVTLRQWWSLKVGERAGVDEPTEADCQLAVNATPQGRFIGDADDDIEMNSSARGSRDVGRRETSDRFSQRRLAPAEDDTGRVEPQRFTREGTGTRQPVLVYRSGFAAKTRELTWPEYAALNHARAGTSVAEICERFVAEPNPTAAAQRAFQWWVAAGLFVEIAEVYDE